MGHPASLDRGDHGCCVASRRGRGTGTIFQLRGTPAWVSGYFGLRDGLDLAGDPATRLVQWITQSSACFGSSAGGVSVQEDRFSSCLRESHIHSEKDEQAHTRKVISHRSSPRIEPS